MDAFLRDFGPEFAERYRGYAMIPGTRLNGVRSHRPLRKLGIDPMSKVLVFSDNLDWQKPSTFIAISHRG